MNEELVRSTLYLDSDLRRALKLKAASSGRSMSEIVNTALRQAILEDQEDLAAFEERASEPTLSYEDFLKQFRADAAL